MVSCLLLPAGLRRVPAALPRAQGPLLLSAPRGSAGLRLLELLGLSRQRTCAREVLAEGCTEARSTAGPWCTRGERCSMLHLPEKPKAQFLLSARRKQGSPDWVPAAMPSWWVAADCSPGGAAALCL